MRALTILLLCSCAGGGSSPKSADLAMSPGGNFDLATMPSPGGMTDTQYCDTACATLIGCGVEYGSGCSAGCLASTVFLACIKKATLSDCNAMSLCSFEEYAKDNCGGNGGVPAGTNSCADTANCEGDCNLTQLNNPTCPCNCIAGLLPIKASALLINNQCALSKCSTECGPTGSGSTCNSCAATKCATEEGQCSTQ